MPALTPPAKILVLLPSNLGDVIMATPVIEGLKKKYKGSYIAFFVEEGFDVGLTLNPFCDRIVQFPRKQVRDLLCGAQWQDGRDRLKKFVQQAAEESFDTIVNLSQPAYVSFLVPLFGGKTITGQHYLSEGNHCIGDAWSQYLYAIPFARMCNNLHTTDVYRRIAGVKSHEDGCTLLLADGEKAWARQFLESRGIGAESRVAVFQPGAAFASKCWPAGHFVALGKLLAANGWRMCVTGAPAERVLAESIVQKLGAAAVCAAGETTFRQSAALLTRASACITGDTAQMHAAAALGVATYALFGPTNPVETGPYGNNHIIFSGNCPHMPCFKTECTSCECMASVRPEIVYACIRDRECPKSYACNVYKTSCRPNSDYSITACKTGMHRYFREGDVCLVRNIFDDRWNCLPGTSSDFARGVAELGAWLEIVSDMCNALIKYEGSHAAQHIKTFEELKRSLSGFSGVGAFCTAILNIRLNSVPLFSPIAAVKQSVDVCWQTHKQVGKAIA
jgi:heptosyltransferase I